MRGPAGLFKETERHPFCWGVLDDCNRNPIKCPVDIITFHRKGNGNDAKEILDGSLQLLDNLNSKYINLTSFKFSNSEADPIKKWSEPRDFQADTRYAAILVATIFEHWQAMYEGKMKNLDSLSHDNAFLNFFPHIFTQRTLLARFQMNNTKPQHIQFVQKPAFAAIGLVASVGEMAGEVSKVKGENVSFVVTKNELSSYSCIVLWSQVDTRVNYKNKSQKVEISVVNLMRDDELFYLVEALDAKRTNPSNIYNQFNKPAFPDPNLMRLMRSQGNPLLIEKPTKVAEGKIVLNLQLMPPYIVSIRICKKSKAEIAKISNLRVRRVNNEEIAIFWFQEILSQNCVKSFEIFFKYAEGEDFKQLETPHIPFLHHQLHHKIPGCFKVRSRNMFNEVSEFSKQKCIS